MTRMVKHRAAPTRAPGSAAASSSVGDDHDGGADQGWYRVEAAAQHGRHALDQDVAKGSTADAGDGPEQDRRQGLIPNSRALRAPVTANSLSPMASKTLMEKAAGSSRSPKRKAKAPPAATTR